MCGARSNASILADRSDGWRDAAGCRKVAGGDTEAAQGRPGAWSELAQRGCDGLVVVHVGEGGGRYTGVMGPAFT